MVAPLFVGRNKSVSALSSAMNKDKRIFLATQRNAGVDNPWKRYLRCGRHRHGASTAAASRRHRQGVDRRKTARPHPAVCAQPGIFEVELSLLPDTTGDTIEVEALMRAVIDDFTEYAGINKSISKELLAKVSAISDPSKLADSVASHFSFKLENKQQLLETVDLGKRLALLVKLIKLEIEVYQMDQRIKGRVKDQMEKTQKNYYLNEQMRAIKKEMGAEDDRATNSRIWKRRSSASACPRRPRQRPPGIQKAQDDDAHVGRSHGGAKLHRLDDQPALVQ
jgi:ATP-dependent Lon protease